MKHNEVIKELSWAKRVRELLIEIESLGKECSYFDIEIKVFKKGEELEKHNN
jgi:hypothetical protein